MPQGWDLGVPWGAGGGLKIVFPKFNQSWNVSYLNEWHMQRHNFLGPSPPRALGGGAKVKISLNLNYLVDFKDF